MEDDDSVSHKPLPQYGILKDEAKEYESKVRQFYAGKLFLEPVEKVNQYFQCSVSFPYNGTVVPSSY